MPIATRKGTFYHLPKAGGTWLTQVLLEQFLGKYVGPGGHIPVWYFLPPTEPAFGVARDPFSLYASFYRFALRGGRQGGIAYWGRTYASQFWDACKFKAMLYGMTHPWEMPEFEEGSLGIIFNPVDPVQAAIQLRSQRQGFASWLTSEMFGTVETHGRMLKDGVLDPKVRILRQSRLNADLAAFMGEAIRETRKPAANSSTHIKTEFESPNYLDWYDVEMKQWVISADGYLNEMVR